MNMKLPEPIAWMFDDEIVRDWITSNPREINDPDNGYHNVRPLYSEAQVKELLAQADQDLSDAIRKVLS